MQCWSLRRVTVKACSLQSLSNRNAGLVIASCGRARPCRARAGIGSNYRLLHESATDADAYLRGAHINVLVLDLGSAASRRCGPASSAASRGRPDSEPVAASRSRAGWFPLRRFPGHHAVKTESRSRLPAAKARTASPFSAHRESLAVVERELQQSAGRTRMAPREPPLLDVQRARVETMRRLDRIRSAGARMSAMSANARASRSAPRASVVPRPCDDPSIAEFTVLSGCTGKPRIEASQPRENDRPAPPCCST